MKAFAVLPPWIVLEPWLRLWLNEDIGRGDRTSQYLFDIESSEGQAVWIAKASGVIAGLTVAQKIFQLVDERVCFQPQVAEGQWCQPFEVIAKLEGSFAALLMGERVALNLAMRLSGIATLTRHYIEQIAELPCRLVDTRKTTPGLRLLEKYACGVGGAGNHRFGLDDAVMLKDNHLAAFGGISSAIEQLRCRIPHPLTIEVETETLAQVQEAITAEADLILLDNMSLDLMSEAVQLIRGGNSRIKIEASGNITLENIRAVGQTGVDYISTSAPITRSTWLDLSMKMNHF